MSQMVTVYRSQGLLVAEVVKGRLESAGVPVYLKHESLGAIMGITVDGLGLVEVQTPAQWADEARAILAEPPESAASTDELESAWATGEAEQD